MIAHLDCSTGVSGDKFLGALMELGTASGSFTCDDLAALLGSLAPEARVVVDRVCSHGIAAASVRVEATEQPSHRSWGSIRGQLEAASLPTRVRERALAAFALLAEAEAKAHAVPMDDVHFHEIGALDSILDVVGVCAALDALGIESLTCSPIAVGWGTVQTSHGELPVPAPATAFLLEGLPTTPGPARPGGSPPGELTTPTGAALVRACASSFGPAPAMTPERSGYGAGTRDIGHPNVCRVMLGTAAATLPPLGTEAVTLLETNIDHISPEAAAVAADQLLAEGALDVWTSPIVMKKGRAAFLLSVLVTPDLAEHTAARVVSLTGSLGVRRRELARFIAERDVRVVETRLGPVRIKEGGGLARPEADDVARIARENGVSFDVARSEIGAVLALDENGS